MKFDVQAIDPELDSQEPRVGDVYPAQGNRPTAAWVIVATSQSGSTAYMLGIDRHGAICSTASYNFHALRDRLRIGTVDLSGLNLTVQPVAGSGRAFRG